MLKKIKLIGINLAVFFSLLLVFELALEIYAYHKAFNYFYLPHALKERFGQVERVRSGSKKTKLDKILEHRKKGVQALPFYAYNPQLHDNLGKYILSHPTNSVIVSVNETNSEDG